MLVRFRIFMQGLVIAGTQSGCGKTTVALALMAALVKRSLAVMPFKVGPDFIDPGHHTRITGLVSRNLDGWMMSAAYNRQTFRQHARNADFAVVEGVMGLFDGYDGRSEAGSTAQMAKWLNLPILLVVDARSMARSAAALVKGFEQFDPNLQFMGVLFNNIGSNRHLQYLKDALKDHVRMPCLGGIMRNQEINIPERHLGLATHQDHPLTHTAIDRLADLLEQSISLERLIADLPQIKLPAQRKQSPASALKESVRIGVALDNAFCFYYQDNLDLLQASGAEIVPFSPIADPVLPAELAGIYFGGGYPELFVAQLGANTDLREQIRDKYAQGMPIYAECGGFMYLCRDICDLEGRIFPMVGIFPYSTAMFSGLRALGYREITLTQDTLLGRSGLTLRGHEFHYSRITASADALATVYRVASRTGMDQHKEGYQIGRCLGSYIHLHFGSCPDAARCFVQTCLTFKNERRS